MRSRLSAAIVGSMLAAACGEPTAASSPTLDAVVVIMGSSSQSASQLTTAQMHATAHFADIYRDVTRSAEWRSSNPEVATVSATGVLTEVGAGTTEITATYQGKSGSILLEFPLGSPWDY